MVGPNGYCGKSNIIDAVRRCIFERCGESMQDVIQWLDHQTEQAKKVELVFDNAQGRLPDSGRMPRLRSSGCRSRGESTYYININVHVRRKDVIDLSRHRLGPRRAYAGSPGTSGCDLAHHRSRSRRSATSEEAAGVTRVLRATSRARKAGWRMPGQPSPGLPTTTRVPSQVVGSNHPAVAAEGSGTLPGPHDVHAGTRQNLPGLVKRTRLRDERQRV